MEMELRALTNSLSIQLFKALSAEMKNLLLPVFYNLYSFQSLNVKFLYKNYHLMVLKNGYKKTKSNESTQIRGNVRGTGR